MCPAFGQVALVRFLDVVGPKVLDLIVVQDQLMLVGLLGGSGAGRVVRGGAIDGNDAAVVRTVNTSLHTGPSHSAAWNKATPKMQGHARMLLHAHVFHATVHSY